MEIKFLFPIDGDVLTPDDGQLITEPLYGERLWIPVRLRVSGIINQQDVEVTVNEYKATKVTNPNPEELPAIGITVVDPAGRSKGVGTEALRLFIEYMKSRGYPAVYTQTWSGNLPMLRVAEKLGFREVCRKTGIREVRGQQYDAVTFRLDL